ncbi:Glutathione S-transferase, omega [hydrothermal vent metagenome]|uniref:Glutathione S-transferase, omega n=1 Tax=hydrothermal vent metagenome TaxID=652676 RepID=A0A3B0X2W9_9ZZZZ
MMKEKTAWLPTNDNTGEFKRKDSEFRHWITADGTRGVSGESGFKAETGRYHLYVSLACPWAHRTLIFRQLKALENHISVSVVHPDMPDNDWTFQHDKESEQLYGTTGDTLYNSEFLSQRYAESADNYTAIVSVPVLWDKRLKCIVNNESSEIIRMFNSAFDELTGNNLDFYPEHLHSEIEEINELIYHDINNGVYKTGFASTQKAYENNCKKLFYALDKIESILGKNRYLIGNQVTEADWRLLPTLLRFDAVYHTHFKCNVRLLQEYENIYNYMLELYQYGKVRKTFNMAHIKRHYYASHLSINPSGIVALSADQDWCVAHNRGKFGSRHQ